MIASHQAAPIGVCVAEGRITPLRAQIPLAGISPFRAAGTGMQSAAVFTAQLLDRGTGAGSCLRIIIFANVELP